MEKSTKVFISYSNDTKEVKEKVKHFADTLLQCGVDVELDQYTPAPQCGWPDYMLTNIHEADFVLCICTEDYKSKTEHSVPKDIGKGVKFENNYIIQRMYESENSGNVIPVILDYSDKQSIPQALKPYTYYCLSDEKSLGALYAILTGQDKEVKPIKGTITTPKKFASMCTNTNDLTKSYLQELREDVFDSIIVRMISNGVSEDCAKEIIDEDISSTEFEYIFSGQNPIKYLVGDFGSGKSYALQILCLKDIFNYEHNKVFPAFVEAKDFLEDEFDNFFVQNRVYGNDKVRLYIDGLDEISYDNAKKIMRYVEKIARRNKNFSCVVSSRPNFLTNSLDDAIYIKKFSEEKLCGLITKISGMFFDLNFLYEYDESIVQTISSPFFAIVFAVLLKKTKEVRIPQKAELIKQFIDLSIRTELECKKTETSLMLIASNYIDNEMMSLDVGELDESIDLSAVSNTGYINIKNSKIDFPLPIIAQWFGAQAIKNKIKSIEDIISSDANIIRWRYCLSILFGNLSFAESKNYIAKIIQAYPGLASMCLHDSTGFDMRTSLPKADKCGEMMYYCFEIWKEALGDLAKKTIPMTNDKVNTLFVGTENQFLIYAFGSEYLGNDVELYTPYNMVKFPSWIKRRVPNSPLWPWMVAFEYIKRELTNGIENRTLFTENNEVLFDEYLWNIGCGLLKKGSLYDGNIPLSVFDFIPRVPCVVVNGSRKFIFTYSMMEKVREKKLAGLTFITYSTIPHNKAFGGGYVWNSYTEDMIYLKAKEVYEKAFLIYNDLVNKHCFGNIEKNMTFKILQPAKLVAEIRHNARRGPSIAYYFLPQNYKKDPSTDITFKTDDASNMSVKELRDIFDELKFSRPLNYEFGKISYTASVLDIFNGDPISRVVYDWIAHDLKEINWFN